MYILKYIENCVKIMKISTLVMVMVNETPFEFSFVPAEPGLQKLLDMVENKTYKCDYPHDPDISHINSSIIEVEPPFINYLDNFHSYRVIKDGDIIKDIHITGEIETVFITIGSKTVFRCDYDCDFNSTEHIITPFKFGIPFVALRFQEIIIYVNGTPTSIKYKSIYLDNKDRIYLAQNKLLFETENGGVIVIENGCLSPESKINQ